MFFQIILFWLVVYFLYKMAKRKLFKPSFANQTVWVVNAESEIGQQLTKEFANKGATVLISGKSKSQLDRIKLNCDKNSVETIVMDITQVQQVRKITEETIKELQSKGKRLDIVIENNQYITNQKFVDLSFENHIKSFSVMTHGPFNHIQAFTKHMIKNKHGHIVGITSIGSRVSTAYKSSYSGARNAFVGILDCIRTQLSPFGINVTNIMVQDVLYATEAQEKANTVPPTEFAREAIRIIYNQQFEATIIKNRMAVFYGYLRYICPDLLFYLMYKNGDNKTKKQQQLQNE